MVCGRVEWAFILCCVFFTFFFVLSAVISWVMYEATGSILSAAVMIKEAISKTVFNHSHDF